MSEKLYHINLAKEDIEGAKYALIAGDPGRIPKIAGYMKNARQLGMNREYNTYLAEQCGEKVVVMSHGIGGPSTAIAVEELHKLGVESFIRIGTCGGIDLDVKAGDVVVISGAIRAEGTSKEYLPIEFPAVADLDITVALRKAARALNVPYHVGVAQCKDSFYGQHDPGRMPVSYELLNKWEAWKRAGTKCSEMETAALFTICASLGAKGGGIMSVVWNQEREAAGLPQDHVHDTTNAIEVAVQSLEYLIRNDL